MTSAQLSNNYSDGMIDLLKIAQTSKRYNLHSHTQFCDGRAPMAEFVTKAIDAGFSDYGFSPHSPIPFESPCNMTKIDVPTYIEEIQRLKTEYAGKIRLYASMEIDYLNSEWGPSNEYFDTLPLDYRIGSVHFVPCDDFHIDTDGNFESFKEKMSEFFDNDIYMVVSAFYDQTIQMIEAGGFNIIGHFDKIGLNASYFQPGIEQEKWYRKRVKEVIDAIMDTHLIAEINTKSLAQHKRFFPHERYFRLMKQYGMPVVINSDAHHPELIESGRQEAIDIYNLL